MSHDQSHPLQHSLEGTLHATTTPLLGWPEQNHQYAKPLSLCHEMDNT